MSHILGSSTNPNLVSHSWQTPFPSFLVTIGTEENTQICGKCLILGSSSNPNPNLVSHSWQPPHAKLIPTFESSRSIHIIRPWKGFSSSSMCVKRIWMIINKFKSINCAKLCDMLWIKRIFVTTQRSFYNYLWTLLESLVSQWHEGHAPVTLISKDQKWINAMLNSEQFKS